MQDNFNAEHKSQYVENLKKVGEYCPESKKEELGKVI